jgi:outer membrane lipoprotein-sorting protein
MTEPNRRAAFGVILSGLVAAGHSLAGPSSIPKLINPPSFNAADKQRIARATAYLQNLASGTGRFQQTDYRGKVTLGTWYLQRPGKIRLEYDAPSSLLVVADGKNVSVWDPRLKSFDQYPLNQMPLSLFLSKQIRFDQGVVITAVGVNAEGFQLTARDRRRDVEGMITLNFVEAGNGALRLKDWTVVDAQNRATKLQLVSFSAGVALNPALFALKAAPRG